MWATGRGQMRRGVMKGEMRRGEGWMVRKERGYEERGDEERMDRK